MQDVSMAKAQRFFATGLSLITSKGPAGDDVMAAEWTMQISYEPMLIAVFIHGGSTTLQNIKETKRFGVNVASEDQSTLVSVAGGFSRREVDKLGISGLFQSYRTRSGLIMIKECVINAECMVQKVQRLGDHEMVVGRVVAIRHDETKKPIIYHRNRYLRVGSVVEPERDRVLVSKEIFDAFSVPGQAKFITKVAGVIVTSGNKVLVHGLAGRKGTAIMPHVLPPKGSDYRDHLQKHLRVSGLGIYLKGTPRLRRLFLQNGKQTQRLNLVLFEGFLKKKSPPLMWVTADSEPFLRSIIR